MTKIYTQEKTARDNFLVKAQIGQASNMAH